MKLYLPTVNIRKRLDHANGEGRPILCIRLLLYVGRFHKSFLIEEHYVLVAACITGRAIFHPLG